MGSHNRKLPTSQVPLLPSTTPASTPLYNHSILQSAVPYSRRRNRSILGLLLATALCLLVLEGRRGGSRSRISSWLSDGKDAIDDPQSQLGITPEKLPAAVEEEEAKPLTELGFEADLVYENIGSLDLNVYRRDLEEFLERSFPAAESNWTDIDSLMHTLHDFLPPPPPPEPTPDPQLGFQRLLLAPWMTAVRALHRTFGPAPPPPPPRPRHTIPEKIHQTSANEGDRGPPERETQWSTWLRNNPDYTYRHYDNQAMEEFVKSRFADTAAGSGILATYDRMREIRVMQSDFWRYLILATEGGVYSDMDTVCLKPIDGWHRSPWQRSLAPDTRDPFPRPAVIVGIEQDVGNRADWHQWWPRPVGIVQWTMASTRGHPIFLDVLRRVTEAVNPPTNASSSDPAFDLAEQAHRKLESVVEKTGPGPFTDSVLRYLGAKYNTTWPDLRQLPNEGILFMDREDVADVLVLSVTAFSPGVGNFGAGDVNHAAALVQHLFSGSWKAQHG